MSLIPTADRARLQADFAAMTRPVRLLFFTESPAHDTCLQTRQILDELPTLSPQITIDEVDFSREPERASSFGIDRVPAIVLLGLDHVGHEHDTHIRFLGAPSGYEFVSLVRAILLVGGGASMLSAESLARLAAINTPMTIHVFSTPTCAHCPRAVTLAHEIAYANPNVTAFAVEATEYPDLARRFRVTGVPKTIINDRVEILGAVPEDTFVERTLAGFTGHTTDTYA